MRRSTQINSDWHFIVEGQTQPVTLPHSAVELPFEYLDETAYQHTFSYRRTLHFAEVPPDTEIRLRFDGAMADTRVVFNGIAVAHHRDGYTPFEARLTDLVRTGKTAWKSL